MKKEVGLWVDHRKAVIVTVENEVDVTRVIQSNMEKHVRFSDDNRSEASRASHGSTAEDMRDRKFKDHLDTYYKGIISLVRDAEAIWIFGPGEAKVELETMLKHEDLGEHIVGVDTMDKMTDPQIAARVRDRFLKK